MNKKERSKERRETRRQEISALRSIPYAEDQRCWSSATIAVVTGGNRAIGFQIAKQLAEQGLTLVLTSRDAALGNQAARLLQESGLNVLFHQLDIVDQSSLNLFAAWIQQTFGGLDILVNNAGSNFNLGAENSVEFAEKVMETNYYGTKRVLKAMVPLMRPSAFGARIINVTSRLGRLDGRRNRIGKIELRQQLEDVDSLSEELIDETMGTFIKQVRDGTWESGGWPQVFTDYSLSKLGVNAYTRLLARMFSDRPEGDKICITSYCPGWVKTAMTGWEGHTSPQDAADTGVWLALQSDLSVSGKFFAERREINF